MIRLLLYGGFAPPPKTQHPRQSDALIWLNSRRLSLALLSATVPSVGGVAARSQLSSSGNGFAFSHRLANGLRKIKHHLSLALAGLEAREDRIDVLKTHLGDFGLYLAFSGNCHSTKKPIEARAMTAVASAPPKTIQRGNVR